MLPRPARRVEALVYCDDRRQRPGLRQPSIKARRGKHAAPKSSSPQLRDPRTARNSSKPSGDIRGASARMYASVILAGKSPLRTRISAPAAMPVATDRSARTGAAPDKAARAASARSPADGNRSSGAFAIARAITASNAGSRALFRLAGERYGLCDVHAENGEPGVGVERHISGKCMEERNSE